MTDPNHTDETHQRKWGHRGYCVICGERLPDPTAEGAACTACGADDEDD